MPAYVGEAVAGIMSDLRVQVYLLGARCKDGCQLLYVCECRDMASTREVLLACDDLSTTTTARETAETAGYGCPKMRVRRGVRVTVPNHPWTTDLEVTGSNLPRY